MKQLSVIVLALLLQGCVGSIIGVATDAAIEVAKIPFKVGGAIIDAASEDAPQGDDEQ